MSVRRFTKVFKVHDLENRFHKFTDFQKQYYHNNYRLDFNDFTYPNWIDIFKMKLSDLSQRFPIPSMWHNVPNKTDFFLFGTWGHKQSRGWDFQTFSIVNLKRSLAECFNTCQMLLYTDRMMASGASPWLDLDQKTTILWWNLHITMELVNTN